MVNLKGFMSQQVTKSGKSPQRSGGMGIERMYLFRGGPLHDQRRSYSRFALYLDVTGDPLRPLGCKLRQAIGAIGQIDGIYCIGEGEYVWATAQRAGLTPRWATPRREPKEEGAMKLLSDLRAAGFAFWVDGQQLFARPISRLTVEQLRAIQAARSEMMACLAKEIIP